jgi:pantetheine-phosphate adenylyltransferase/dephospho-CoA kinase
VRFLTYALLWSIVTKKLLEIMTKIKIGITGNIGAGKSAVMGFLTDYPNNHTIKTDDLARAIMAEPAQRNEVVKILGEEVFENGELARGKIADSIFNDWAKKVALENFIFPILKERIEAEIARTDKTYFFIESALIFEANWTGYFDQIVVITAPEKIQRQRLKTNRSLSDERITTILNTQDVSDERLKKATWVISNEGMLYDLKVKVAGYMKTLPGVRFAVYAGSFDPGTFGHLEVIERSRKEYDIITMLVGTNEGKKAMFTAAQRVDMGKRMTRDMGNVLVDSWPGLTVEYAAAQGAGYLLRGTRGEVDTVGEEQLRAANEFLNPKIQTVFVEAKPDKRHISSSIVKVIFSLSTDWEKHVAQLVPYDVMHELRKAKYVTGLRTRFVSFISRLSQSNVYWAHELFDELIHSYNAPHRFYHNCVHLYELFKVFDSVRHLLDDPDAVEYALWIHDWFYDIVPELYPTNVPRSAEKGLVFANKCRLPERFYKTVEQLVMVTDHADLLPKTNDEKFIVDIDLSILSKSEFEYDRYEKDIRTEFNFVPRDIYYPVRKTILTKFLDREYIYYTDFFRTNYEEAARLNLSRTIVSDVYTSA